MAQRHCTVLFQEAQRLINTGDIELAKGKFLEGLKNYAKPNEENDAIPDFEFAAKIKSIDDCLRGCPRNFNEQPSDLNNELPKWSLCYLKVVMLGGALSYEKHRLAFFKELYSETNAAPEPSFLYAMALCDVAADSGDAKLFNESLEIFDTLEHFKGLCLTDENYYTGGETQEAILSFNRMRTVKQYVLFIQKQGDLEGAIEVVEDELKKDSSIELSLLHEQLLLEQRMRTNLTKMENETAARLNQIQEKVQTKHIEILGLFFTLITLASGGLLTLFAPGKMNSQEIGSLLYGLTLALSFCFSLGLSLLPCTWDQKIIRSLAAIILGLLLWSNISPISTLRILNESTEPSRSNKTE